MAFEMSLPHAPRIQTVGPDGAESLAQDEQQWDLYFTVQQALAAAQEGAADTAADGEQDGEEEAAGQEAPKGPKPSDPQRVLEKLLNARGELDVITDLVTFVEQQQFLSVAGIHRHPPSLEERVRARSLRLAAAKSQLRAAAERLAGGAAALRAQEAVEARFLADLAELRRRWRLRRHAGEGAMFYADISLPLRGAAGAGISQEGAQCSVIMDTNGDACIVEAAAAGGGTRRAVRGWRHISSVLAAKLALLSWQVLRQVAASQAQQAEHEADADGAVAAVRGMVEAAVAASQAAVYAAVADAGGSAGGGGTAGGAAAMDVDGGGGGEGAASVVAATAAALPAQAAGPTGLDDVMLSSAAKDIRAALAAPGFQARFQAQALRLLAHLLPGEGCPGGGTIPGPPASSPQAALFGALLHWLRHAALCQRVDAALCRWAVAAPGRAVRRSRSGEESTAVWQLVGGRPGQAAPVLAIAVGGRLRLEGAGGGGGAAARPDRGMTRAEFDAALQAL